MSSTSTNGSGTSPAGSAISPASTPSSRNASLKFCANQLQRTTVHSVPAADQLPLGALRLRLAAAGEQHEPLDAGAAASCANAPMVSAAPATARSGK